jgi:hypothetical protein
MAPATAPTGPSTSAPDKAPSAASPVRSWAVAAEDINAKEIVTIAIVFFIQDPPDGCATMFSHAKHGTIDGVLTRCLGCHTPTRIRSLVVYRLPRRLIALPLPIGRNIAPLINIGLFLTEFELLARPVAQRVG